MISKSSAAIGRIDQKGNILYNNYHLIHSLHLLSYIKSMFPKSD